MSRNGLCLNRVLRNASACAPTILRSVSWWPYRNPRLWDLGANSLVWNARLWSFDERISTERSLAFSLAFSPQERKEPSQFNAMCFRGVTSKTRELSSSSRRELKKKKRKREKETTQIYALKVLTPSKRYTKHTSVYGFADTRLPTSLWVRTVVETTFVPLPHHFVPIYNSVTYEEEKNYWSLVFWVSE